MKVALDPPPLPVGRRDESARDAVELVGPRGQLGARRAGTDASAACMFMLCWVTISATSPASAGANRITTTSRSHCGVDPVNPVKSCRLPTSTTAIETTTEIAT